MQLIKVFVSIFMVVGLSLVAEFVSPRVAGILSGYPLGAAISLFFIGFEIGPQFAGESALYTMTGLVGIQGFIYCYYLASSLMRVSRKWLNITTASLAAFWGYLLIIYVLNRVHTSLLVAIAIPLTSFAVFRYLFKKIRDERIENRIGLSVSMLFGRAFFATAIILLITWTAKMVGPKWAGLFSAFPITLFPVIVIVHFSYRLEHVHTLIRNVPSGLVSLFIYAFVVHLTYPRTGIYVGTLLAYVFGTLYLIIAHMGILRS